MEQIERQKHIDNDELKRIVNQLLIGTALAIGGLRFLGLAEVIREWIED